MYFSLEHFFLALFRVYFYSDEAGKVDEVKLGLFALCSKCTRSANTHLSDYYLAINSTEFDSFKSNINSTAFQIEAAGL